MGEARSPRGQLNPQLAGPLSQKRASCPLQGRSFVKGRVTRDESVGTPIRKIGVATDFKDPAIRSPTRMLKFKLENS
jgi:hypothetical protein